jgi:hypothetical protein
MQMPREPVRVPGLDHNIAVALHGTSAANGKRTSLLVRPLLCRIAPMPKAESLHRAENGDKTPAKV